MKRTLTIAACLALTTLFAGPAGAAEPQATAKDSSSVQNQEAQTEADRAAVSQAFDLIGRKEPAQALATLAPVLSRNDARIAAAETDGMVFCAPSTMEVILYATLPATQKKNGVVLGAEVCEALFAQSYALVELDRKAEALATLQRLTALAPMHGHYFVELGFAYRVNGQNDKAEAAYRSAIEYAEINDEDAAKKRVRAMGQRGLGYMLIEKGDLGGAEKAYKQSLKDDPTSDNARSELEFIAQQRKAGKST